MYELSTATKIIRIEQAIAAWKRLLDKELAYLPHNQDHTKIAEYRNRIAFLQEMISDLKDK